MNTLQNVIRFLLYSRLFIAIAATGLCLETDLMLNIVNLKSVYFYCFIFCATLFTYNFYYLKSNIFNYTKHFAGFGFVGMLVSFLIAKVEINLGILSLSIVLSTIYLLPIYVPKLEVKFQSIIKLFLLIAVWGLVTIGLVVDPVFIQDFVITKDMCITLFVINRMMLLIITCGLFFLKDELHKKSKQAVKIILVLALIIQCVNSIASLREDASLVIFILNFFLLSCVFYASQQKTRTYFWHLLLVDGILVLQGIFALLFYIFLLD